MSTPLRYIPDAAKLWRNRHGEPIAIVEVTIRSIMGIFLLVPRRQHVSLLKGVIGRALATLDFELYGYAYLSNHGSILIGIRDAQHLARVMEFIHGNIARELGRMENSNWRGRFWARRGRPILILSNDDLAERMRYLLSNSTKEDLVKHPTRWPGAHCARALCEGTTDTGLWIDRTGLYFAKRAKGAKFKKSDFETYYRLRLTKLPCWSDLDTDEAYRQQVKLICREIAEAAAAERLITGKSVLGVKAILRMHPHHRPDEIDRSPAPPVHCRDAEVQEHFLDAYRCFC